MMNRSLWYTVLWLEQFVNRVEAVLLGRTTMSGTSPIRCSKLGRLGASDLSLSSGPFSAGSADEEVYFAGSIQPLAWF
jgi:hypothetical protein